MPKPIDAMPSVIMNGETPASATPAPLAMPMSMPAPTPASIPTAMLRTIASGKAAYMAAMAAAPNTDVTARIVPTDRSNPARQQR